MLNIKLKHLKSISKDGGPICSGILKRRKKILKEELDMFEQLEEVQDLSPDNFNIKAHIQAELYDMNTEEENYWFQRSHARWLLHGDLNTSYFHKIANGRKRKNTLHYLDDNGVLVEGAGNVLNLAVSHLDLCEI